MRLHDAAIRLSAYLEKQSRYAILAGCLVAVTITGIFDYSLPFQVSMSIFYSLPIMFTAWYADRKTGDLVAIVSLIITWWTDELTAPPEALGWIHTYRMLVRLFFYLFFSLGAAALRAQRNLSARQIELNRNQIELLERSQRLEREIVKISEREQRRIGHDLHDGLCQYLAALSCAAVSLRNDLQKRFLDDESRSAAEIAELLKQGVTQARNLARGLSPVHDDESGLHSALHELADYTTHLQEVECIFAPDGCIFIRDHASAGHLYRIAQEALNNAIRHGQAQHVTIFLCEREDFVTLTIADDGAGIPASADKPSGMGLKIMDYRARMIGGELHVANNPEGGTTVTCCFRQQPESELPDELFPFDTVSEPDHAEHALTA